VAARLNQVLRRVYERLCAGAAVEGVEADATAELLAAGFARVDYVEARAPATLERLGPGPASGPIRVLAAAHLGKARLIDNLGD
jgi:pantoate--beta-alanine ligase